MSTDAPRGATPARMGVLFLNSQTRPPLGADTWIHARIMRHLDRATHDVHIACVLHAGGTTTPTYDVVRDIPDVRITGIDLGAELDDRSTAGTLLELLRAPVAAWSMAKLARLIRRHRIQIIHTSDRPRDALASVVLARLTGATALVHVHVGFDASWMGRPLRWSLRHAGGLIAISQYVGDCLVATDHDPERVHVVMNGIEVADWDPDVPSSTLAEPLPVPDGAPILVTICRLFPAKGVSALVEAVATLGATVPDLHLLVVGTAVTWLPDYPAEVEARAAELGIADRVHLIGRRSDVAAVLGAADVFAMPSTDEPFGLVFAEAMAMRRPVVGVANGGTLEVVADGETGVLVPPDDPEALVAALAGLFGDPARRAAMGAAGRRRVTERFTADRMTREVERVYSLVRSPALRSTAGPREMGHAGPTVEA